MIKVSYEYVAAAADIPTGCMPKRKEQTATTLFTLTTNGWNPPENMNSGDSYASRFVRRRASPQRLSGALSGATTPYNTISAKFVIRWP